MVGGFLVEGFDCEGVHGASMGDQQQLYGGRLCAPGVGTIGWMMEDRRTQWGGNPVVEKDGR